MELAFDGAILLCQRIYVNAVAASDNIGQCRELAEHVQGIEHLLQDMLNDLKISQNKNYNQQLPPALFSAIEYLEEALEHAGKVIDVYGKRGRLLRYFLATKVQSEFNGAFKRIDDALQRLSAVNVQLVTRVKTQLDDLTFNMETMSYRLSSEMEKITSRLSLIFDQNRKQSDRSSLENSLLNVMSEIPDMDPSEITSADIDDLIKAKDIIKAEKEQLDALMLEQIIAVLQQQQQEQLMSQYQQQQNLSSYSRQKSLEPPSQIVCPLTLQIMKDPVILHPTGQTYERSEIEHWFERGNRTDPLTGVQIDGDPVLTPNFAVKNMIDDFYNSQNAKTNDQIVNDSNRSQSSSVQNFKQAPPVPTNTSQQVAYNGIYLSPGYNQQNDTNNNIDDSNQQNGEGDTPFAFQQNGVNFNNSVDFHVKNDNERYYYNQTPVTYPQTITNDENTSNNVHSIKNSRGIANIKRWPRWIWALLIILLLVLIAGSVTAVIVSGGGDGGGGEGVGQGDNQGAQDLTPELQTPDPDPDPTPLPLPPKPAASVRCIGQINKNFCRPLGGSIFASEEVNEMEDYANCLMQFRDEGRCSIIGGSYCKFQRNLDSPDLAPEQCIPNISPSISELPDADNCLQYFEQQFLKCARNTNQKICPSGCQRVNNEQKFNCIPRSINSESRQSTVDNYLKLLNSNQFSQFQSELNSRVIEESYYCRNVVVPLVVFDLQGKNFTNIGYIAEYFWSTQSDQQIYRGYVNCYSRESSTC